MSFKELEHLLYPVVTKYIKESTKFTDGMINYSNQSVTIEAETIFGDIDFNIIIHLLFTDGNMKIDFFKTYTSFHRYYAEFYLIPVEQYHVKISNIITNVDNGEKDIWTRDYIHIQKINKNVFVDVLLIFT